MRTHKFEVEKILSTLDHAIKSGCHRSPYTPEGDEDHVALIHQYRILQEFPFEILPYEPASLFYHPDNVRSLFNEYRLHCPEWYVTIYSYCLAPEETKRFGYHTNAYS